MSVLRDPAGLYRLERDEEVSARISATNVLGTSEVSDLPSVTATVRTLPAAPTGLARGAATSETVITLEWSDLETSEELGGDGVVITSYHVEWQPSDELDAWAELAGYSAAYLQNSVPTNPALESQVLTSGNYYKFQVRAQNAQGWGPWSEELIIQAADIPADAGMATIEDIDGEPSVRVSWAAPDARGSDILEYLI